MGPVAVPEISCMMQTYDRSGGDEARKLCSRDEEREMLWSLSLKATSCSSPCSLSLSVKLPAPSLARLAEGLCEADISTLGARLFVLFKRATCCLTSSNEDTRMAATMSPLQPSLSADNDNKTTSALQPSSLKGVSSLANANISSPHELTDFVENVLDQLESRFNTMSGQVESRSESQTGYSRFIITYINLQ
jgi:hypothetical protein